MKFSKWTADNSGTKSLIIGALGLAFTIVTTLGILDLSDKDGDIRHGDVVIGYTIERHREVLEAKRIELTERLGLATQNERRLLYAQMSETRRQLVDLEASFHAREAELEELRTRFSTIDIAVPQDQIDAAQAALSAGDTATADALLAEVQGSKTLPAGTLSDVVFMRAKIAGQDIRLNDAAEHHLLAARLNPTYETMLWAGSALSRAVRNPEAVRFEEELIDISQTEFGPESREHALALHNLGASYLFLGRYDEAEPLLQSARRIFLATSGRGSADYHRTLNQLAALMRNTRRIDEALALLQESYASVEADLGKSHQQFFMTATNLAALLGGLGRPEEAAGVFQQAIDSGEDAFGGAHPELTYALNNYGVFLAKQGKDADAEAVLRRAIKIRDDWGMDQHPDQAGTLKTLAILLERNDRLDEVPDLYAKSLQIRVAQLGRDHFLTRRTARDFADFLVSHGNGEQSARDLERLRKTFGPGIATKSIMTE